MASRRIARWWGSGTVACGGSREVVRCSNERVLLLLLVFFHLSRSLFLSPVLSSTSFATDGVFLFCFGRLLKLHLLRQGIIFSIWTPISTRRCCPMSSTKVDSKGLIMMISTNTHSKFCQDGGYFFML